MFELLWKWSTMERNLELFDASTNHQCASLLNIKYKASILQFIEGTTCLSFNRNISMFYVVSCNTEKMVCRVERKVDFCFMSTMANACINKYLHELCFLNCIYDINITLPMKKNLIDIFITLFRRRWRKPHILVCLKCCD